MADVRVVVDADVIVAAMRSPSGASAAILRTARRGRITLLVSVPPSIEMASPAFPEMSTGASVARLPGLRRLTSVGPGECSVEALDLVD